VADPGPQSHHGSGGGSGISTDPWAPPDGWVGAPEQGALVCDVFVPSKVQPLTPTFLNPKS
jgi:hypothetical protein